MLAKIMHIKNCLEENVHVSSESKKCLHGKLKTLTHH